MSLACPVSDPSTFSFQLHNGQTSPPVQCPLPALGKGTHAARNNCCFKLNQAEKCPELIVAALQTRALISKIVHKTSCLMHPFFHGYFFIQNAYCISASSGGMLGTSNPAECERRDSPQL